MIPENKYLKLNREFRTEKLNSQKKNESLEQTEKETKGTTIIEPINAKDAIKKAVTNNEDNAGVNLNAAASTKTDDKIGTWSSDINIKDFIKQSLESEDIEVTDELVNKIFIEIVKSMVGENPKITLVLTPSISWVTQLIDSLLVVAEDVNKANASKDDENTPLITKLIDMLLGGATDNPKITTSSTELVKRFILSVANDILAEQNNPEPNNPDPITTNDLIDTGAYPAALSQLINSMNGLNVDENMSIKDFLLQLQTEASQYIRQQNSTYSEGFSDFVAMFLAQAVSDTQGTESGLMKDVDAKKIKEKFLEFIQDLSFLDTSTTVWARSKNSGKTGNLEYFSATPANDDGYKIVGRGADSLYIHGNDDLTYNADGSINNGVFLKYLLDFVNTTLGGELNGTQLSLVMEKIIVEFSGNNLWHDLQTATLYQGRTKNDKNKNNTFFDELYNAIIKVTNNLNMSVGSLDTVDTNAFINTLFGSKTSISASYIHNNENNYLINNDPAVRAIMSGLINASNRYNVTTNVDYLDFLNVFIKQIYEICGEPVKTSGGQPVLTKEILQKYFETHTLQDLKDFVESTELRNAYYMENFISTGGINEEINNFNQGLTGDCWLLACIDGLQESERGRQILANAIDSYVGEDGKTYYTVTLQGGYEEVTEWDAKSQSYITRTRPCNKVTTYTFSLDDIFNARGTGNYSRGDWDVLLLEMAISKLKEEQYYHGVAPDEEGDPFIHGGHQVEMLRYLVGNGNYASMSWYIYPNDYGQDKAKACKDYFMGLLNDGTIQSGTVGENYLLYINYGGHAYSIIGVTEEGLYYADPYHPETQKFISWDELANCIVGYNSNGDPKTKDYIEIGRILLK